MNASKITTIIFDADDTLWLDSIYFRKLEAFLTSVSVKNGKVKDEIQTCFSQCLNKVKKGENGFAEAIRKTAQSLRLPNGTLKDLEMEIQVFLQHDIEPTEEIEATLSGLHSFKKIMLTKGIFNEQINKINSSGMLKFFDQVIVVEKKEASKFKAILDLYDLTAVECIMIGNSIKHDIIPAVQNNMHAVWYNHDHNSYGTNETLPEGVIEINHWRELYRIISD